MANSTFQQRHYIVIAAALKAQRQPSTGDGVLFTMDAYVRERLDALAEDLAERFAADNSNFKHDVFMRACGLGQ